jgi:putative membrane protein
MMHFGNFSGMGIGGFGFGWIFMILFWVFVVLGVIYLTKALLSSSEATVRSETAENILKRRYASGEISKEEFHETMSVVQRKI